MADHPEAVPPGATTDCAITLGILSDTHGLLRPEVFTHLDGVDLILHAGDVGPPHLLTELEAVAPVLAVYGNTDGFDIRSKLPEIIEIEIAGVQFVILHGHQFGRTPGPVELRAAYPGAEVIIFGHTHVPLHVDESGCTIINPGSCGPRRFNLPVGLVRGTLAHGRFEGAWQAII